MGWLLVTSDLLFSNALYSNGRFEARERCMRQYIAGFSDTFALTTCLHLFRIDAVLGLNNGGTEGLVISARGPVRRICSRVVCRAVYSSSPYSKAWAPMPFQRRRWPLFLRRLRIGRKVGLCLTQYGDNNVHVCHSSGQSVSAGVVARQVPSAHPKGKP